MKSFEDEKLVFISFRSEQCGIKNINFKALFFFWNVLIFFLLVFLFLD